MRFRFVLFAFGAALCAPTSRLVAQSDGAISGWAGLISTPAGALPPVLLVPPATGSLGTLFQLRYGRWGFPAVDGHTNSLGASASFPTGTARTTLELGVSTRSECAPNCRGVIGGVDMNIPLTMTVTAPRSPTDYVFSVALNPAAGFMREVGDNGDGYALSLSGSVPVSVSFRAGRYVRIAPFLAPGGGVGRIGGNNNFESGFRWMLGGGVALAGITPGVQLTGSFRKIFIEDGPTTFGLGLTIGQ
jgi:hypothetical protein